MREFRRTALLRGAPVVILVAVLVALALPAASGIVVGLIIVVAGAVTFVLPYWTDRVTFASDGRLIKNRTAIRPEDLTRCRFAGFVSAGRAARFRVFALYTREHGTALPALVIPTSGWPARERPGLFQALHGWLDRTGAEVDEQTLERLKALEG